MSTLSNHCSVLGNGAGTETDYHYQNLWWKQLTPQASDTLSSVIETVLVQLGKEFTSLPSKPSISHLAVVQSIACWQFQTVLLNSFLIGPLDCKKNKKQAVNYFVPVTTDLQKKKSIYKRLWRTTGWSTSQVINICATQFACLWTERMGPS